MAIRTRQRSGLYDVTGLVFGGPTGNPWDRQIVAAQNGVFESMIDEPTPNFERMRNRGEIVCTPMRRELRTAYDSCFRYRYWSKDGDWEEGSDSVPQSWFTPFPAYNALLSSSAENEAANKAKAGVASSDVLLAVTLKELSDTVHLLRSVGHAAANLYDALHLLEHRLLRGSKTPWDVVRKAMREVADQYCSARYGISGMVFDAVGMLKAFEQRVQSRETSRGNVSLSDSSVVEVVQPWRGHTTGTVTISRNTTYRAGILYELYLDALADKALRLGLSGADALPTLWEVTKLSFVFDWFLDIGTWLRAVSPKPGVRVCASWLTTITEVSMKMQGYRWNNRDGDVEGPSSACSTRYWKTVKRGTPLDTITLPGSGSGLSLLRSVDAAMLSIQRLTPLLRRIGR